MDFLAYTLKTVQGKDAALIDFPNDLENVIKATDSSVKAGVPHPWRSFLAHVLLNRYPPLPIPRR